MHTPTVLHLQDIFGGQHRLILFFIRLYVWLKKKILNNVNLLHFKFKFKFEFRLSSLQRLRLSFSVMFIYKWIMLHLLKNNFIRNTLCCCFLFWKKWLANTTLLLKLLLKRITEITVKVQSFQGITKRYYICLVLLEHVYVFLF